MPPASSAGRNSAVEPQKPATASQAPVQARDSRDSSSQSPKAQSTTPQGSAGARVAPEAIPASEHSKPVEVPEAAASTSPKASLWRTFRSHDHRGCWLEPASAVM